jgi:hypothetical protein
MIDSTNKTQLISIHSIDLIRVLSRTTVLATQVPKSSTGYCS